MTNHTEIRRGDELVILPETPLEIVRAVENFKALLADAKANADWFDREGYKTEAANIRRLIENASNQTMTDEIQDFNRRIMREMSHPRAERGAK